jgi:hypothetical protein
LTLICDFFDASVLNATTPADWGGGATKEIVVRRTRSFVIVIVIVMIITGEV